MELGLEPPPAKRPRSLDRNGDQPVSGMERLPRDIVLDILSRLPVASIVRFRLVSRSWRELARDPLLPEMQLARTARSEPFLIFHCDFPIRNALYFVELSAHKRNTGVSLRKFRPPFWNNMAEFEVVASCNGILCLADSLLKESIYLYNPFTGDYLPLPRPKQYPNQEAAFGFGIDPKTGDYKVVKVVYYTKSTSAPPRTRRIASQLSDVQVLTVGGGDWRSLGKAPYQIARWRSDALLGGRLHWVTRPRRCRPACSLVSFDLSEERFGEVPIPETGPLNCCNYQLMVLVGSLSAIVYRYRGKIEIWVMKVYGEKDSWAKEYSIGAHVPKGLRQHNPSLPAKLCRSLNGGRVRVLCLLDESGELLLEYKGRALMAYDPKKGKFRDVFTKGTPKWFQSFILLGTLGWVGS